MHICLPSGRPAMDSFFSNVSLYVNKIKKLAINIHKLNWKRYENIHYINLLNKKVMFHINLYIFVGLKNDLFFAKFVYWLFRSATSDHNIQTHFCQLIFKYIISQNWNVSFLILEMLIKLCKNKRHPLM